MSEPDPGPSIRLVVNADDCGYAPDVTRGIVECALKGIVTSTGIFGNASNLAETLTVLEEAPEIETGVHFALSQGLPLTAGMRQALARYGGRFPGKFGMAWLISRGAIKEGILRGELWAQADACVSSGVRVAFLNAHEHLHMHPRVYPIVCDIARELRVRHVRITHTDVVPSGGLGGAIRGIIIRALTPEPVGGIEPRVRHLGLARSGKIDLSYLESLFARLTPGNSYELMCHPGYEAEELIADRRLRAYHDWDLERRTLQDPKLPEMLRRHGIILTRFSDLLAEPVPA